MILQALYQRYKDLVNDPDSGISKRYFSSVDVAYVLEITSDGELNRIFDIRMDNGKRLLPVKMSVPEQGARSSGVKPFYLCDKLEYLLGYVTPDAKLTDKKRDKQAADALSKHSSSKELHQKLLKDLSDKDALAVFRFFERWEPTQAREHPAVAEMADLIDKSTNQVAVFKLADCHHYVHNQDSIRDMWVKHRELEADHADVTGQCLITGAKDQPIARIHEMKVKGVRYAQQAGASLVSFNKRAFESYGRSSSYNAPTSEAAVFGYITALNHLLASERNCLPIMGDMTVVFWSGAAHHPEVKKRAESLFRSFYVDEAAERGENIEQDTALHDMLGRIRTGNPLTNEMMEELKAPFYVLGLSPNNARIGVRFFWQGEMNQLVRQLAQHAQDLDIVRPPYAENQFPTVSRILLETVRKDGKDVWKLILPSLEGHLFRSIMEGVLYPYSLLTSILTRIKVDGEVNPTRAALLKAYLARYARIHHQHSLKEVVTVELNEETRDVPYRLGRLFAVLEKAQADASGGYGRLNSTIKDRYFASAASTPGTVFPLLIKLSQHHMSKSDYGSLRDRELQEILEGIKQLPSHLNLQQQGAFMLGYYHQKQSMFKKGEKN